MTPNCWVSTEGQAMKAEAEVREAIDTLERDLVGAKAEGLADDIQDLIRAPLSVLHWLVGGGTYATSFRNYLARMKAAHATKPRA